MTRGRPRRWFKGNTAKRQSQPDYRDPNRPGSPGYAERHRRFSYECLPGMRRIDAGAPISAPGVQMVEVVDDAEETPHERPDPAASRDELQEPLPPPDRDWKGDYGLGKGK